MVTFTIGLITVMMSLTTFWRNTRIRQQDVEARVVDHTLATMTAYTSIRSQVVYATQSIAQAFAVIAALPATQRTRTIERETLMRALEVVDIDDLFGRFFFDRRGAADRIVTSLRTEANG